MVNYWTFIKKEDNKQIFVYHQDGRSFEQEEAHGKCLICWCDDEDLVGKEETGGFRGICLSCLDRLKVEEEKLKEESK